LEGLVPKDKLAVTEGVIEEVSLRVTETVGVMLGSGLIVGVSLAVDVAVGLPGSLVADGLMGLVPL